MEIQDNADRLGNDLLWGVRAIAQEVGRSERQTLYLLETGQLPAEKVGQRWCSSRKGLRKRFSTLVNGAAPSTEGVAA